MQEKVREDLVKTLKLKKSLYPETKENAARDAPRFIR